MKTLTKLINTHWQSFYLALTLVFILTLDNTPYLYSWFFKILPIALLITYSLIQMNVIKDASNKYSIIFILGLIFSMMGDFILEFYAESGFVFGLASFFIAHIFYIIYLGRWDISLLFKRNKQTLWSLIVISYGALVIVLITPKLGDLLIPVIAYMIILFLMAITALFSRSSNKWIMIGGISFLISDSLIGLNKFYNAFDYSHSLIMISYYLAQYALVKGVYLSSIKSTKMV